MAKKEHIGHIYIDAGVVWIGDPCYVMGSDASYAPAFWMDFCRALFGDGTHESQGWSEPLGKGVGLCVDTTFGDGEYPVYLVTDDEGRNHRIEIQLQ